MLENYGLEIPYHFTTSFEVRDDCHVLSFPKMRKFWKEVDVPRGLYLELSHVVTYKLEEL